MQIYDVFYRKYGQRSINQLVSPRSFTLEQWDWPIGSVWHYANFDGIQTGPDSKEYFLRNVQRKINMDHVLDISSFKGNPKKIAVPLKPYIRQYHLANNRFRYLEDAPSKTGDQTILVIENYAFLPKLYRYTRSYLTTFYNWYNLNSTLWKRIGEVAKTSNRQNFVFVNLPTILPSMNTLNLASKNFNQTSVTRFQEPASLFLLEMWKWISSEYREDSIISSVDEKDLSKINLVFMESGTWTVFNLGVFDSWRDSKSTDDTDEQEEVQKELEDDIKKFASKASKVSTIQLQKRFLKFLMTLMEIRSVANAEKEELEKQNTIVKKEEPTQLYNETEDDTTEQVSMDDDDEDIPVSDKMKLPESSLKTDELIKEEKIPVFTNIDYEGPGEDELTESERIQSILSNLDKDLEGLEEIEKQKAIEEETNKVNSDVQGTSGAIKPDHFSTDLAPEEVIKTVCNNLAEQGFITAKEYKRYLEKADKYKEIPSPFNNQPLGEFIKVKPEMLSLHDEPQVKDRNDIVDKSMLKSTLIDFDKKYIKDVLHRDTTSMIVNVQKTGILLTEYEKEDVEDISGKYEIHTVKFSPIEGKNSTLRFRMPHVEEDGTFRVNGVRYRMRKQKVDLPIVKTNASTVALSSYYGKTFVSRSTKKVDDYNSWLQEQVMVKGLSQTDTSISELSPGDSFVTNEYAPKAYSALAQSFQSFNAGKYHFVFEKKKRAEVFDENVLKQYERNGARLAAYTDDGAYLLIDRFSGVTEITQGQEPKVLGAIETVLDLDASLAPVEYAQIRIFGKQVPVAVFLAYKLGLNKLMALLKVKPRKVLAGQRLGLEANEYAIKFQDETYIFNKEDTLACLILNSLNAFHQSIKHYPSHLFETPSLYVKLLEEQGIGGRYMKEIDLMDKLFIDPVTREVLQDMNEPVTMRGLIVRSCQLLLTDTHPERVPSRVRGYERFSGAVYTAMIQSMREHNGKGLKSTSQVTLHPFAVWEKITRDPSVMPVNEINPIENMKGVESVTTGGEGGRNARTMTKSTRAYDENDKGVISEGTVDSGNVAINTLLSADPRFKNIRGIYKGYNFKKDGATSLISSNFCLAPNLDTDDPKRANFSQIQASHRLSCEGYDVPSIRTGYEKVVPARVDKMFATVAQDDGRVVSLNKDGMVIEYANGAKVPIGLTRRFGAAAGLTIPQDMITDYKVGDAFHKGDTIAWNPGFFDRDPFDRSSVMFKTNTVAKTVLYESPQTHEDASSISVRLAQKLRSNITKVKKIVVRFDQHIRDLIEEGTQVTPESILCYVEDNVTAQSNLFTEDSINTLRVLDRETPHAKVSGVVDRIEVYYYGEESDMSESIKAIAHKYDNKLKKRLLADGLNPNSGKVTDEFSVDAEPIVLDTMILKIFITTPVDAGVGDKGVVANQMKSVFSEVMEYNIRTESGELIDLVFGEKSIQNRIVNSAHDIGTTNTLLSVIADRACKLYFN